MQEKNLNLSNFIDSLDSFLVRFTLINFLLNILLFYFPDENLATFIYIIVEIFFFMKIFKIYKSIVPILFPQMLVMFLVNLTYLNFIIAYFLNNFIFNTSIENIFQYDFYCSSKTYFLANSYLLLFGLSVLIFNKFLLPRTLVITVLNKIDLTDLDTNQRNIFIFILSSIAVELYYYFSGLIGFQATGAFVLKNTQDMSTWYTQFFDFILIFHLILNILFLNSFKNEKISIYILLFLIFSFLLNFMFFSLFEKRSIIIFFLINFFVYFIFNKNKIISSKMFFIYLFSFFLIFQSWSFLSGVRGLNILAGDEGLPLKEIVKEGKIFSMFTDESTKKSGQSHAVENLSKRILNNVELATIFHYNSTDKNSYLYGKLLFSYIIQALPQVIYANKQAHITGEDLISTITSSPQYADDTLGSFQSSAYVDFGLFGIIIYPIMINLLILILYKIIAFKKISNLSGIFISSLFLPLITIKIIETSPTSWFTLIRNILLFIIIFNILFSFVLKNKILKS